jgi:hypothetical protein
MPQTKIPFLNPKLLLFIPISKTYPKKSTHPDPPIRVHGPV